LPPHASLRRSRLVADRLREQKMVSEQFYDERARALQAAEARVPHLSTRDLDDTVVL
jgi:hypothetical protein